VLEQLTSIPGIRDLGLGTPAAIDWSGPDQDWSVAFRIAFDDPTAIQRYLSHPSHSALIESAKAFRARISTFYIDLIDVSSSSEKSTQ